jgi:hypothetical protein
VTKRGEREREAQRGRGRRREGERERDRQTDREKKRERLALPVRRASSVSFGEKTVAQESSAGSSGESTPPASTMRGMPAADAMPATSKFTSSGISRWSSTPPALCNICIWAHVTTSRA